MEKGDKILCIRSLEYGGEIVFKEGEYYIVGSVNDVFYTIDGVSFLRSHNGSDEFNYHFGTVQELRKIKIEKLTEKIYEI